MSYSQYNTPMRFDGDIVITDPCYIIKNEGDDWSRCRYGEAMDVLGIHNYLCNSTVYGDWSCTTYRIYPKSHRKIGNFCADAGLVAVFLLEDILKYNPDYNIESEKEYAATLIKNFHGTVMLECTGEGWDKTVQVVGDGNINFESRQTGF